MSRIIPFLGSLLIRGLHMTLRIKHVGVEKLQQFPQAIVAFWHCHLLLMLHSRYRKPIMVMISQSKDGEYIARVFDYYGVESARGSATRGGTAAMREMIRAARAGKSIAITPDGPKGPPRIAKDGVVYAGQATGLPIVPVAFAAKKKSCCTRGTAWSSPRRSATRCSSTEIRSSSRATAIRKSGGRASNWQ